ncbi:KR domain-containing protein [Pseudomonas sp. S75]|uniref:beta-ketoacyl synthase N-terminal-like domain-containing protein n=1 Tax=unclassified Pseudomonas TaxID=196821 RepID=UPI001903DFD5|nr:MULTISPECIES: beta-ketoacyl synthase N-terminal-like domain-containing protein [unclassified Pseudomonas]MBJ9975373.1 KR domain-containing protein [Pseudomonas sp. S30]MBK0152653.1 KR domain-containing protein [Pseudomonas sp. S75]
MSDQSIAVIGMSCRLPGARDPRTLWRNLLAAKICSTRYDVAHLRDLGVSEALLEDPRFVPVDARMADADRFDAAFFGISIREAQLLDPQQRLLLECAWELTQTSGLGNALGRPCIGLFAGASMNTYLTNVIRGHCDLTTAGGTELMLTNDKDYMCARVAYRLGFEGPCMAVQTGCSSSLSAVHLAVNSLLLGECEVAFAGGVSFHAPAQPGYLYQPDLMFSQDGSCRPFDAQASGTFFGDGVALVALRPLDQALRAGDEIHAVITASVANNDGSARAGFTAPSVEGQRRLIMEAQALAQVSADSIGMIEAHGTGTRLGDPVEFDALCRAFAETTDRRQFCALGSIKANVGHLAAAAGVAGLTKAVLALGSDHIAPHPSFTRANPACDLQSSPFVINTQPMPWAKGCTRRAGVSAFGAGGSNVHLIVEQAPVRSMRVAVGEPGPQAVVLSGRDEEDVHWMAAALADHLRENVGADLQQIAKVLAVGRSALNWRTSMYVDDCAQLAKQLEARSYAVSPRQRLPDEVDVRLDEALYATLEREPGFQRYVHGGHADETPGDHGHCAQAMRQWLRLLLPGQTLVFAEPEVSARVPVALDPANRATSVAFQLDLREQSLRAWLGRFWAMGAEVDWSRLEDEPTTPHCPLPLPPLRPVRCWYDSDQPVQASEQACSQAVTARSTQHDPVHVYVENWQRLGLLQGLSPVPCVTPFALCASDPALRDALIDQLHRLGCRGAGADERVADKLVWLLDDDKADSGPELAWWLCEQVQSLVKRARPSIELVLVGSGFVDPWGAGNVQSGPSAALACVAALAHEHPTVSIKIVDLAQMQDNPGSPGKLLGQVLERLDALPALCAIRASSVWVRRHDELSGSINARAVRPVGTCLVTGGLGTVGFAMAHYLASRQGYDLIVLQRACHDAERLGLRRQRLLALQATGVKVTSVEADISDRQQIHGVLEQLRRDGIQANAFIHAAGASGNATQHWLMRSERQQWQLLMQPKWEGARWLDEWFEGTELRFGCFISSLAVLAGGLGLGPYAAANEACAWWASRRRDKSPYFSIDWEGLEGWQHSEGLRYAPDRGAGLSTVQVETALDRIFASIERHSRFIVSDRPLPQRLASPALRVDAGEASAVCDLRAMSELWQQVLRCPVQACDNFFDLGGDSLVGAELIRRTNARFHVGLAMVDLFEFSSPDALAKHVATLQAEESEQ